MKLYALGCFRQAAAGEIEHIWHLFDRLDDLRPIFK